MHTTLPLAAGLGLRSPHIQQVLADKPKVAWWEIHSENYFGGGAPIAALERVRADYPISLHGVGMGLGSPTALDETHLSQLKTLVERITPNAISEHLSWNRINGSVYADLLPVPRVEGAIALLTEHIQRVQDELKRPILIENVSSYIQFSGEKYLESEILAELVARTGCGILLDVNNLYVSQFNLGIDALNEIAHLPLKAVGEIHIAGFEVFDGVAIDTHGAAPVAEVWQLLDFVLAQTGPVPVLLERDNHIPSLGELLLDYQTLATRCDANWEQGQR
ncbi:MAG: MNIO family bufferin maturase [Deefgea sp.]